MVPICLYGLIPVHPSLTGHTGRGLEALRAHGRSYWPVVVCTGIYCVVMPCLALHWFILVLKSCTAPYWFSMNGIGSSWSYWSYWEEFEGINGLFWKVLAVRAGSYWFSVSSTGSYWFSVSSTSPCWSLRVCTGL